MSQRETAVSDAGRCVRAWFPDARAAWLGGSSVRGTATATSDLDITVLLAEPPAPYRDTRRFERWPVELFVHTEASLAHYRDLDAARRQPTMMRLVGESLVLIDRDGSGGRLRTDCLKEVAAGPGPLPQKEIDALRYAVTNLVDDLDPVADQQEQTAVATLLWSSAAQLLLGANACWTGTGRGLVRELVTLDGQRGTDWTRRLDIGLRTALAGDPSPLAEVAGGVLDVVGGRLLEGYRLGGDAG